MDADTRHQLKQNELAQALRQLWDLSDRRTTAWLGVILVIALAYAGYKLWGWRQRVQLIDAHRALTSVNAADASLGDAPLARLRQLIADNSEPGLVAVARLQLARGLEARGQGADGAAKLADAETQYTAILDMPDAPNIIKAPAMYRLGMLHETRRDFAQARDIYTMLSQDQRFKGSPFMDLAARRLDQLDDLAVPIQFEPGFKPLATTQPASQPAIILKPVDAIGDTLEGPPAPGGRKPIIRKLTGETPPAATTRPAGGKETPPEAPPTKPSEPQQP
ncbi:MAG: hypothetical protein ACE5I3_05840 [Phycisphaerae bacterium]